MKVYVVEDCCAQAVFSSEEKAKEYIDNLSKKDPNIAVELIAFTLDTPGESEYMGIFGEGWVESEEVIGPYRVPQAVWVDEITEEKP